MSPPPKLWTAVTVPIASPVVVAHRQPDQVGMVEFVLVAIVGQRRAVDEELGAVQRLGGVAVGDALEAHDDDGAGRPDAGDLEGAPVARRRAARSRRAPSGSAVKVLTRTSPLMPCAAPMTAIWIGFFGVGMADLLCVLLYRRAKGISIAAVHVQANLARARIGRARSSTAMQQFLIAARPDLQAARAGLAVDAGARAAPVGADAGGL